jgi:deoxycytidylate deaminase
MTMIRLASKIAAKSHFRRARVGAVIVKSGRVLATGCNRIGHSKYLRNRPYPESVHAEQQAVLQLLKQRRLNDLAGSTIYISRILSNGSTANSRPCCVCANLLKAVGIRNVVYTADSGVSEYEL